MSTVAETVAAAVVAALVAELGPATALSKGATLAGQSVRSPDVQGMAGDGVDSGVGKLYVRHGQFIKFHIE